MKCINKSKKILLLSALTAVLLMSGCKKDDDTFVSQYMDATYNKSLYQGTLFATDLCVEEGNVDIEGYTTDQNLHATALFDLTDKQVLHSFDIHQKTYPASITKIMTALLALEYGNFDDEITISSTAAASSFPSYAQVCGLEEGDVWTLKDLLNALLVYSGNDAAKAIGEYVAGTEEDFVNMMNIKAKELMANNTHFMNTHGLHDDNHYTTAYDIYLIFSECIKDPRFVEIISGDSYTAKIKKPDGSIEEETFKPTNLYAKQVVEVPDNVTIVGGKTGTTDEAGSCLVLLEYDDQDRPYISIVLGAPDKNVLYTDMSSIIRSIPAK